MSQAERVESEELKRAEPAGSLQQEQVNLEHYLDAILLNLPVGVAILEGPDFRYFRINKRLADLNGLPVEDHLGRPVAEVLPDSPNILPNLRKVRNTGKAILNREFSTILPNHPDKHVHLMDFHFPIRVEGEVRAVGAVVLDITKRRRAEEAQSESEARYRDLFAAAPLATWEEDFSKVHSALEDLKAQGVTDIREYLKTNPEFLYELVGMVDILDVNATALKLVGAADKDELLAGLQDIFVPATMKIFEEEIVTIWDGRTYLEGESLISTLQRKQIPIIVSLTVTGDPPNYRRVIVTLTDITELKRAEEALRQAREDLERRVEERTKDLQENEARLQRLLESTSAIPWMADARTWLFTYVGPRAVDIFGYPLDQWYEKDFWVNHIHPEDREAAIDFCMKSLRSLEEFEFEYRMIAADGSVVWLHDLVSVERENGEPQTLQGFLIDVTERKQLEEESRQHKAALAHLTRVSTLGELAASLSHELNQPLTAIVSNAQASLRLLSRDTPDLDELRAALTDITDDGKRAGEVIHRLRTMQKKGDGRRDRLDINEVIREVLSLYRSDAMLKDISVELDLALNLPPVLGDQIQLQQVVLNLLLNASEAVADLEPGSRKVVLGTSRVDSNTIEVHVRDFGTGLAPENGDRIFDAFFTTKPEGMGMGLSISRSIIEEHGGRLWATQSPERGATFHFTLPLNNGVSR